MDVSALGGCVRISIASAPNKLAGVRPGADEGCPRLISQEGTWGPRQKVRHVRIESVSIGDPQSTPFTYFTSGSAVFPPNTLIRDAEQVLALLDSDGAQQKVESLVRWGNVGHVGGVLPESTWFAFIRDFLFREPGRIHPRFVP